MNSAQVFDSYSLLASGALLSSLSYARPRLNGVIVSSHILWTKLCASPQIGTQGIDLKQKTATALFLGTPGLSTARPS
jgi:hypothetical protein